MFGSFFPALAARIWVKFTYMWCNDHSFPTDVSPTEVSWILRRLDIVSLTEPSLHWV
jgi:hypothetical protein